MSAPCLHLDGLVNDLDTPIFFELPPTTTTIYHEVDPLNLSTCLSLPRKSGTPTYNMGHMPPIELVLFSIAQGAFMPQREGYCYEKKNKKTKILHSHSEIPPPLGYPLGPPSAFSAH